MTSSTISNCVISGNDAVAEIRDILFTRQDNYKNVKQKLNSDYNFTNFIREESEIGSGEE